MARVNWQDEQPAYRRVGVRKKMNTDFPVENKVERTGPHTWRVLYLLCDGTWDHMRIFNSRRAAYQSAGIIE